MASEGSAKPAQEALDVISNRISLALAKHDNLVKSWTAASSRPKKHEKTQEELEAEDAALFQKTPTYLGVGAPIPSHFLVSDAERNNKTLRAKFFPTKGLKGSKPRDEEEKAASAKRAKVEDSSDEEEGRSSLGKAKKQKKSTDLPSRRAQVEKSTVDIEDDAAKLNGISKNTAEDGEYKDNEDAKDVISEDKASSTPDQQPKKSAADRKKERKKLKKLLKRKEKKNKK
jgi:hypothetical protein